MLEITKLFFVHLDFYLVPLGHDPIDLHEGFALGLRDNDEDVNDGGQADGTEDKEAIGSKPFLEE